MLIECPTCQSHFVVSGQGDHPCPVCDTICRMDGDRTEWILPDEESTRFVNDLPPMEEEPHSISSSYGESSMSASYEDSNITSMPSMEEQSMLDPETMHTSRGHRYKVSPARSGPQGRCAIHPDNTADGICTRCGNFLCPDCRGLIDAQPYCADCYYKVENETHQIPWEENDGTSVFSRFWRTSKGIMFSTNDFFKHMPVDGGMWRPLFYAIIVYSIALAGTFLLGMLLFAVGISSSASRVSGSEAAIFGTVIGMVLVLVLFLPLGVAVGTLMWSAIYHFCLRLLGGGERGFEATFRVCCYAFAPSLLMVIPICGPYILSFPAGMWQMMISIVGAKEVHRMGTGSAAIAYFLPFLFFGLLAVVYFIGFYMVAAR